MRLGDSAKFVSTRKPFTKLQETGPRKVDLNTNASLRSPLADLAVAADDAVLDVDRVVPHAAQHDRLVQGPDHEDRVMTLCKTNSVILNQQDRPGTRPRRSRHDALKYTRVMTSHAITQRAVSTDFISYFPVKCMLMYAGATFLA